jgi:hypothetical protein
MSVVHSGKVVRLPTGTRLASNLSTSNLTLYLMIGTVLTELGSGGFGTYGIIFDCAREEKDGTDPDGS